jgi:(1->4)-alpha-D-glucan 1-alpha-D-glucosylmutase
VYRSDYQNLSALLSAAIAHTVTAQPALAAPLELVSAALVSAEPAARLQQLCGAMTAKSVEDCYFYRDPRLVSLNEVGGEPAHFGISAAEFHRSAQVRGRLWPRSMTTLSTHDTKRGEDVRARIGVLSQVPSLWGEFVASWQTTTPAPDPATALFLLQNIFGVWPADGQVSEEVRTRLHAYTEKAIREAAWHTSWNDPNTEFEDAVHAWLDAILDGPVATELTGVVVQLEPHAHSDALGQKLLALTVPGIPDIYQGTELWEDSLVDPDNRRPVDYSERGGELERLSHPKMRVVRGALQARRDRPDTFLSGPYRPVLTTGSAAHHVVAFSRGSDVLVAVTRWTVRLRHDGWGDTILPLPEGVWTDRLTGARFSGPTPAGVLFGELPVVLLERSDA